MNNVLLLLVVTGAGVAVWAAQRRVATPAAPPPINRAKDSVLPVQARAPKVTGIKSIDSALEGVSNMVQGFAPRGIRNHNPGNIRKGRDAWQGAVGDDGEYLIFSEPKWGIRAIKKILNTYRRAYGLTTIHGIISRWAPDTENDTSSYVQHVADLLGVPPTAHLDENRDPDLIAAIILHENGEQPYSPAQILEGVALAG